MTKSISIVIPVLNEESYIGDSLASVRAFSVPDGWEIYEIIVLDGGSKDGTCSIIAQVMRSDPRVILLDNPGKIQSAALNIAIKRSACDFMLRLDAHAVYPADYLEKCVRATLVTQADNVGGVCITMPGGLAYGALLVQALTTHRFGVGNSGFRVGAASGKADTVPFGFFRREIFSKIGMFDERLVRAQDYEVNRRIAAAGGTLWLDPEIKATYFNQPAMWPFLKKQFAREAPYNFYMWYLAPYTFTLRHAITACFTLGMIGGVILWPWLHVRVLYLSIVVLYVVLACFASVQQAVRYGEWRHIVALPFCFFLYHFLHGSGVLLGGLRLATRTAPVQKIDEPWAGAGQFRAWPPPDGQSWAVNLQGSPGQFAKSDSLQSGAKL